MACDAHLIETLRRLDSRAASAAAKRIGELLVERQPVGDTEAVLLRQLEQQIRGMLPKYPLRKAVLGTLDKLDEIRKP